MQVRKQLKYTQYMDTITFDKVQTILVARRSVTNVTLLRPLNYVTYFSAMRRRKQKLIMINIFGQKYSNISAIKNDKPGKIISSEPIDLHSLYLFQKQFTIFFEK